MELDTGYSILDTGNRCSLQGFRWVFTMLGILGTLDYFLGTHVEISTSV